MTIYNASLVKPAIDGDYLTLTVVREVGGFKTYSETMHFDADSGKWTRGEWDADGSHPDCWALLPQDRLLLRLMEEDRICLGF